MRAVCARIGIPYYSVNFAKEYYERVFTHFLDEYRRGRTPNPDVLCNREIKFSRLSALCRGAGRGQAGHWPLRPHRRGEWRIRAVARRGRKQGSDLFSLSDRPEALSMAMFPVGGLTKPEIRAIAREAGLPVSDKKDSTAYALSASAISRSSFPATCPRSGRHGHARRQGGRTARRADVLHARPAARPGIGGSGDGRRWFVVGKDIANNRLIVQQGEDSPLLYSAACEIEDLRWLAGHAPAGGRRGICLHGASAAPAAVAGRARGHPWGQARHHVRYAPTRHYPRQATVLYQGELCLGGGTVDTAGSAGGRSYRG